MNPSAIALVTSLALGLSGCAATLTGPAAEPCVKPGLILLTADEAQRCGVHIRDARRPEATMLPSRGPRDATAVIRPDAIKAYPLARSVDPFDPELMHEAHVVYRRETSPRWRLDVPASQQIMVGPRVTDGREEIQPLLDKELMSFLADERRARAENQKAITALFQAVDALSRQQQAVLRAQNSARAARDQATPPPGPSHDVPDGNAG